MKHNPKNERIKRKYFSFLKEAKRQAEPTVDTVAKAIARFEKDTKWRDFKRFHFEQAVAFKRRLLQETSERTGEPLSKSTIHSTLRHLKDFFEWLSMQPGYRCVNYSDAEYFNLSRKDTSIARAKREKAVPTVEQIHAVLGQMPSSTDIEKRDRALVAFTILTGARDAAIASMKLRNVDLEAEKVFQDARNVNTKFSKSFDTYFFPVGGDALAIVRGWVKYLDQVLLFGPNDPLFPKTQVSQTEALEFKAVGLTKAHWSDASPIRRVFREAFEAAGLPYFNPHSFRNTLATLAQKRCQSPEEVKAWSQNLGHEKVMTTFYSYGEVQSNRQAEIFQNLKSPREQGDQLDVIAQEVARRLRHMGELNG